jgi:hypothetical protein
MLWSPMKKLAILIATGSLALATPVFACPHDESAPKTADKAKDSKGSDTKAKDAPKKDAGTAAKGKEQPKQDTAKPDKVSQK